MKTKAIVNYDNQEHIFESVTEDDHIFKVLKSGIFYELKLLDKIKSLNLKGTYIDVGANIGNHSVFFNQHCDSEKVISIEISKTIHDVLSTNLKNNTKKRNETLNIGIAHKKGFATISDIPSENVGMTKVIDYDNGEIPIDTMDNLFGDLKNITLIKIDIEGGESHILLGMDKILTNSSPVIFAELQTKDIFDIFQNTIEKYGYITDNVNYATTPTFMWYKQKIDVVITITSYNRLKLLEILLQQIDTQKTKYSYKIILLNDGSTDESYKEVGFTNKYKNLIYLENESNNGRELFWKTINKVLDTVKNIETDYVINIPDDFYLCDDFIDNVVTFFKKYEHEYDAMSYNRIHETSEKQKYSLNWGYKNWVDGADIYKKDFFECFNFKIDEIDKERFVDNSTAGSGVWAWVTRQINKQNLKVLKPPVSFARHDGNDYSNILKAKRDNIKHKELLALNFKQKINIDEIGLLKEIVDFTKITASLASFPEREKCLRDTVESILPQVDKLQVYLNNYENIPEFLNNEKIKVYQSQSEIGDLNDAGKFYKAERIKGYHLTIDDDIVYPVDYVKNIIKWVNFYNKKAVISLHGRIYGKLPIEDFRNSKTPFYEGFNCLQKVIESKKIDVAGSGVMAYHTSLIKFSITNFLMRSMSDIWVAILCNRYNVPIYVIPHEKNYINMSSHFNRKGAISYRYIMNSDLEKESNFHTDIINNYLKNKKWEYFDIVKTIIEKELLLLPFLQEYYKNE